MFGLIISINISGNMRGSYIIHILGTLTLIVQIFTKPLQLLTGYFMYICYNIIKGKA